MDRTVFQAYIEENYGVTGERLWEKYPSFTAFRHGSNRKWFAVVMEIPKSKLILGESGTVSVVNLKCDPRMIGTFREEPGIFPGWHMNKAHWLSVVLDGTVGNEKIKFLVDISYELTKK